jgi:DnaK suppressor protein
MNLLFVEVTMRKRELNSFRKLLTRRLEQLLMEAEKTRNTVKSTEEAPSDPMDQASDNVERDFLLRLRDRESKLIAKIKEALERIEDGTFSICEECGGQISVKRLRARPMATLCIDCKSEQEALEKRKEIEAVTQPSGLWSHG